MDNYHTGQLTCVGNTLKPENCFVAGPGGCLSCVGFDNGMGSTIFQVNVMAGNGDDGAPSANYSFVDLTGLSRQAPQTPGPWPCTVSPSVDSDGF